MATKKLGKIFDLKFDSTKKEEIEALVELAENVAPQTFLADIFSKPFIDWAVDLIEKDFTPSVTEHFRCYDEEIEARKKHEAELSAKIENIEKRWTEEVNALMDDATTFQAKLASRDEQIANLQWQLTEVNNKVAELLQSRDEAEESLEGAEAEIIRLKAKLYDLIMS